MIRSFRKSGQKQKVFTLRNLSAQPRHAALGTRNLRNCRPDQGRFASRDNKPIRADYGGDELSKVTVALHRRERSFHHRCLHARSARPARCSRSPGAFRRSPHRSPSRSRTQASALYPNRPSTMGDALPGPPFPSSALSCSDRVTGAGSALPARARPNGVCDTRAAPQAAPRME